MTELSTMSVHALSEHAEKQEQLIAELVIEKTELQQQLAAANRELERVRKACGDLLEYAMHASVESGYCMCGDSMENHSGMDHAPVDAGEYGLGQVIEQAQAALASPAAESKTVALTAMQTEGPDMLKRRYLATQPAPVAQSPRPWPSADEPYHDGLAAQLKTCAHKWESGLDETGHYQVCSKCLEVQQVAQSQEGEQ